MTAAATWSTHGLLDDQARDASGGKNAGLAIACQSMVDIVIVRVRKV
jgi:hypothetical protein